MSDRIENLINQTADKAMNALKSTTVLGEPLTVDGVVIIPVYKISYGFGGGGFEKPDKKSVQNLSGGAGAGVTKEPVAYITVNNGQTEYININDKSKTNKFTDNILKFLKKDK